MNKFDKEVEKVAAKQLSDTDKKLFKAYRESLIDLKKEVKRQVKVFDTLTPNQKVQLKRKQQIIKQVNKNIDNLFTDTKGTIYNHSKEVMKTAYNSTFYKLEGANSLDIPFAMLDDKLIRQTVNAPVAGKRLSQRLYSNRNKLAKMTQSEIIRGLVNGDGYQVIAGKLNNIAESSYRQSYRIARTEGKRVRSIAQLEAQKEAEGLGIDLEKMWVASLDGNTRDTHADLDGKRVGIKEEFEIDGLTTKAPGLFGEASEDINCRCTMIEVVKGFPPKFRRDNETGKTIAYKNYREWERDKLGVENIKTNDIHSLKIPDFKPSKTLEEAENYANKFVGNGYAPHFKNKAVYKGMSLEHANEINKTFEKIYHNFDIEKINGIKTISPLSKEGKKAFKSGSDALMAYNPIEHGIYLNKDILKDVKALQKYNKQATDSWDTVMNNIDKLSGDSRKIAERYRLAGRSLVGGGTVEDYLIHELGHHIQYTAIDTKTQNLLTKNMGKYSGKISGYATSSRSEYFAESFVAYTKGEIDKLDPVYVKYIKGNKLVKSQVNKGKIEFVNSRIKLKAVPLERKEYANVMSELNTHLTKEELKGGITSRAIGNYLYTVEVNSFGDYVIIGKEIIK